MKIKCKYCGAPLAETDNQLKAILTCETCGRCLSYNISQKEIANDK